MADDKMTVERFSALLKDLIAASRDGILVVLALLLLLFPATIKERLLDAGFTKGNIGGLEWEGIAEETRTVGQAVSQADEQYNELIDRLAELEKKVEDPDLKQSLNRLGEEAQLSRDGLIVADKTLKRSLSAQQAMVQSVAPSAVPEGGWMYLGKVNEEKTAWEAGSPATVKYVDPSITPGTQLTMRDDVYWRADAASGSRSRAPILSVARVGTVIEVEEIDWSHARGGGWFVWVKAHTAS
jgi:hypothetical protein